MNFDDIAILNKRAETRKDGVYYYRSYLYVVKNNKFICFSDFMGNCYQRMGAFNTSIGKVEIYDRKKKLLKWLKMQN